MSTAVNAIATRQRSDLLWESSTLLAAGGTFTGAVRLVAGYGGINVFISSNLSFRLRIEEACSEDGPWTETDRETSALNEEGTRQIICRRFVPCGGYARIRIDNLGGALMTAFNVCLLGLPVGDSTSVTLAGPGGAVADVRNADACADFAGSLNGFLTNSRTAVYDRALADWCNLYGDLPNAVNGVPSGAVRAAYTNSVAVGLDSTGVSVMRPVEARSGGLSPSYGSALIGLLVKAQLHGFDPSTAAWEGITEDEPSSISGTGTAAVRTLFTTAIATGIDNTGAAVLRPVEARNADVTGDFVSTLIGLLTNSRMSVFDLDADWVRWSARSGTGFSGITATTILPGVYAGLYGTDNTGAALLRAVEARNYDADADVVGSLVGLLVNARLSVFDFWVTGDHRRWQGTTLTGGSGVASASVVGAFTLANVYGQDTTGASVTRAVEARNYDVVADVASSLVGLLCNTRNSLFIPQDLEWGFATGIRADSVSSAVAQQAGGASVYQVRESAFGASVRGRRFYSTHQTPNTVITAQASFVATTPTFMLRQAATAVRVILRNFTIFVTNTPTDDVRVTVMIDTADRFSAGGTSHTPQNTNEESATASGITSFLSNPTAIAAGAGTRVLVNGLIDNVATTRISIDFKDGVLLSTTASLLVYVFGNGGATPADVMWIGEFEEVA